MSDNFGANMFMNKINVMINDCSDDDIMSTLTLQRILRNKIEKAWDKLEGGCCFFGGGSLSVGETAVMNLALVNAVWSKIHPLIEKKKYKEAEEWVKKIDVDQLVKLAETVKKHTSEAEKGMATLHM